MQDNTVTQSGGEVIQPTVVKPHAIAGGAQRMYRFPNGYGASVVRFQWMGSGSYGAAEGLWEMAVIHYDGDDFELVYDTPVTEDVIGWLDEDGIQEKLRQIRDLPARVS